MCFSPLFLYWIGRLCITSMYTASKILTDDLAFFFKKPCYQNQGKWVTVLMSPITACLKVIWCHAHSLGRRSKCLEPAVQKVSLQDFSKIKRNVWVQLKTEKETYRHRQGPHFYKGQQHTYTWKQYSCEWCPCNCMLLLWQQGLLAG